jgi:DNA-binding XRE family transcriptional regulator
MSEKKLRNWHEIKSEFLKDPEVLSEYEALRPQFEVISQIIKARSERGITQAELAELVGTQQSNISRLESGSYNPSVEFLAKIAQSLDMKLHIEFRSI